PQTARRLGEAVRQFEPTLAAVAAGPDAAVVGADPELALLARRLVDRRDRAVGHVALLLVGVVAGEIRTDRHPLLALVARTVQVLAAGVDRVRRVRRQQDRRVPVEAQRRLPFAGARLDAAALAGAQVLPAHAAELRLAVDDVPVVRSDANVEAVAAVDAERVLLGDAGGGAAVDRKAPRAVVLQAAVDAVRHREVGGHRVELQDRQARRMPPGLAVVVGLTQPAVVAEQAV